MSRDGRGERITVDIQSEIPVRGRDVDCGSYLTTDHSRGRYGLCAVGHLHCRTCGKQPKRFRKGYTHVCKFS